MILIGALHFARTFALSHWGFSMESPHKDFIPKLTGRFPTRELSLYRSVLVDLLNARRVLVIDDWAGSGMANGMKDKT